MEMLNALLIAAAIYARVSTDGQERDGTSLDTQVAECRAFAERQGYRVSDEHIWRDTIPGVASLRPGFSGLLAAVQRGEVEVVTILDPDRLARDPLLLMTMCEQLREAGAMVLFLHGPSGNSPEDRLVMFILGWAAGQERMKIAERTMRGKRQIAMSGRLPIGVGSHGIFGYDYDPETKKRTINETEAAVVRLIFQLWVEGWGSYAIANELNDRGIPTKTGRRWDPRTLENILDHWSYVGWDVYGKYRSRVVYENRNTPQERRRIKRELRPESEWIWIQGFSPAILEGEIFKAARRRRAMPKAKNRGPETYLATGHTRCPKCGTTICGGSRMGGKRQYRCRGTQSTALRGKICDASYIEADMLEETVFGGVALALKNPDVMMTELELFLETGDGDLAEQVGGLKKQIRDCQAKEARYLALFGNEVIDQETLLNQVAPVRELRKECQRTLEQLEKQRALAADAEIIKASVRERCRQLAEGIDDLDFSGKQELLNVLDVRVLALRGKVSITMTVTGKITTTGRTSALRRGRSCRSRPTGIRRGWMNWLPRWRFCRGPARLQCLAGTAR